MEARHWNTDDFLFVKSVLPASNRLETRLARQIQRMVRDQSRDMRTYLNEADLCRYFGVSHGPMRGALKQLTSNGVLSFKPGVGYCLLDINAELPASEAPTHYEDRDLRLVASISRARNTGILAD